MAVNKIYKFKDIQDAQAFLNGALFGSPVFQNRGAAIVRAIVGKTINIAGTTVTFVAAASAPDGDSSALLFKDIKAQVEATVATVRLFVSEGRIGIIQVTPTTGVTVTGTGTANSLLGFDIAASSVSKVYTPSGITATAPCWVNAQCMDSTHIVYTWE